MLNWNTENVKGEAAKLLTELINDILVPCFIWRAGRSAEAIRAMATQTLYAIGDSCPTEAYEIFPKIGKHLSSLSEDDSPITRAYAIRCILKSGPFSFEDYHQLIKGYLRSNEFNGLL